MKASIVVALLLAALAVGVVSTSNLPSNKDIRAFASADDDSDAVTTPTTASPVPEQSNTDSLKAPLDDDDDALLATGKHTRSSDVNHVVDVQIDNTNHIRVEHERNRSRTEQSVSDQQGDNNGKSSQQQGAGNTGAEGAKKDAKQGQTNDALKEALLGKDTAAFMEELSSDDADALIEMEERKDSDRLYMNGHPHSGSKQKEKAAHNHKKQKDSKKQNNSAKRNDKNKKKSDKNDKSAKKKGEKKSADSDSVHHRVDVEIDNDNKIDVSHSHSFYSNRPNDRDQQREPRNSGGVTVNPSPDTTDAVTNNNSSSNNSSSSGSGGSSGSSGSSSESKSSEESTAAPESTPAPEPKTPAPTAKATPKPTKAPTEAPTPAPTEGKTRKECFPTAALQKQVQDGIKPMEALLASIPVDGPRLIALATKTPVCSANEEPCLTKGTLETLTKFKAQLPEAGQKLLTTSPVCE